MKKPSSMHGIGGEEVLGRPPEFSEASSNLVRPDQWRLIGGGIASRADRRDGGRIAAGYGAIPCWLLQAWPGGIQMFKEAYGSLRSFQMGSGPYQPRCHWRMHARHGEER